MNIQKRHAKAASFIGITALFLIALMPSRVGILRGSATDTIFYRLEDGEDVVIESSRDTIIQCNT